MSTENGRIKIGTFQRNSVSLQCKKSVLSKYRHVMKFENFDKCMRIVKKMTWPRNSRSGGGLKSVNWLHICDLEGKYCTKNLCKRDCKFSGLSWKTRVTESEKSRKFSRKIPYLLSTSGPPSKNRCYFHTCQIFWTSRHPELGRILYRGQFGNVWTSGGLYTSFFLRCLPRRAPPRPNLHRSPLGILTTIKSYRFQRTLRYTSEKSFKTSAIL